MNRIEAGTKTVTRGERSAYLKFLKASKACSGSVVAQAAMIAVLCRKSGEDPDIIGSSLAKNQFLIGRAARVAEYFHKNHPFAPIPVSNYSTEEIVRADFSCARELMDLEDYDLNDLISNSYPKLRKEAHDLEDPDEIMIYLDNKMIRHANSLLRSKGFPNLSRQEHKL